MNKHRKIEFGVGAFIVNGEGKIFLAQRGKDVSINTGKWESPGGRVEFGETMAGSLRRELREEHGVEIEVGEMIGIVEFIAVETDDHWVGPAFICKITSGKPEIREPDKCVASGWFTLEEAEKLPLTYFAEQDIINYRKWLENAG